MPLTDRARAAFFAQQTDEVLLLFIEIMHDDLDGPLRFVNNTENIIRLGQTYHAAPFELIPPTDDPEQPPRATIRISNVEPKDLADLRALEGEVRISAVAALASTPDDAEAEYGELILNSIDADAFTIEGELSMSNVFSEPWPSDAFTPAFFRAVLMAVAPAWVASYSGIPFVDFGRTRSGCDCWGLVRLVYAERYGIDLPAYTGDYSGTARRTDGEDIARLVRGGLNAGLWHEMGWKAPDGKPDWCVLREGDGVLLRVEGLPWHMGLVIAPRLMLHTMPNESSHPEDLDGLRWSRRLLGFYRHHLRD